jgi:multicomponent Na+:H+ antiporter subunit B
MNRTVRLWIFGAFAAALAAFLLRGLHGLPDFGHYHGRYGHLLNRVGVRQRHSSNVVTSVVFDYRGIDTLGEEFILFSAVVGVVFILRGDLLVKQRRFLDPIQLDAQRVLGSLMVPIALVMSLWLIAYGYVTPGGGFQGGVAVAASLLLIWVATSYRDFRRLVHQTVADGAEGLAAAGFVGLGVAGLGLSGAYLANVLPLGTTGTLFSSGSIALLNWLTGIEVAGAIVVIYLEFLQEYGQTFPGLESGDDAS